MTDNIDLTETEEHLKRIVARIESINDEIKIHQDDRKDIYTEAKSLGLDTKILRKIIRDRKKSREEREEEAAVTEVYAAALGMI